MPAKLTAVLVRIYAVLLLVAGATLLFAPEVAFSATDPAGPPPLVLAQILGAALLGFATTNWLARDAILGGIYGRAVVGGNQAFAVIATLAFVSDLRADMGLFHWILLLVILFGAVLHSLLLYRSPRFDESARKETTT